MRKTIKRVITGVAALALVAGMMPGMSLTAKAATTHDITIANTITNGTVISDPSASAEAGVTVKLTGTGTTGYKLKSYTLTPAREVTLPAGTFTMPDENVTVNATFAAVETVSVGAASGGTAKITAASEDTTGELATPQTSYKAFAEETVTFTPEPNDGFQFEGWTVSPTTAKMQGDVLTMPVALEEVTVTPKFSLKPAESADDGSSSGDSGSSDSSTDDQTGDDAAAGDGTTEDGTTEDGTTEDGTAGDGTTEDGTTDDGKTDDGKTDDGKTDDGKTDGTTPGSASTGFADDNDIADYAKPFIKAAVDANIIKGVGDNKFDPKGTATRAQFATMIQRALGLKSDKTSSKFSDVTAQLGEDLLNGVLACEDLDPAIIQGYGDNSFQPNKPVTRAEGILMIWRAAGKPAYTGAAKFNDLADWYAEAANWGAEQGIVQGVGDGKFDGGATLTRQDLATIFGRAIQKGVIKVAAPAADDKADEAKTDETTTDETKTDETKTDSAAEGDKTEETKTEDTAA